jgi:transcriptional regulator with XRE-family HTH domain
MSIPPGFTARQLRIWGMRRDGLSLSDIARRLGVTRQAVSKAMRSVDDKVLHTLQTAAGAAKIEVRHVDKELGVLLGFSHETNERVVVTLSTRHGVQIWHHYTGRCEGCDLLKRCKKVILDEADERGVTLTEEERAGFPAEIARAVFSKVIPGLEP